MSTPFRRAVELKAGPILVLVAKLPKVVPFLAVLALLLAGLFAEGLTGALLLGLLGLVLGVLLYLAWPALEQPARVLRGLIVVLVLARAVSFLV